MSFFRSARDFALAMAIACAAFLPSGCASRCEPEKATAKKSLEDRIPVGFYIYLYNWKQSKDPDAKDLEDMANSLADRGFNYLYVGGAADTPLWRKLLDICERRGVQVVPQLNFAYLEKPDSNVEALAKRAVAFIKKYKDSPAIMAFSVCEEPSLAKMPALKQYYEAIRWEVPDAKLHLVGNYIAPLSAMEAPYPDIIGTDRYGFWWEFGGPGGHRATPWYALRWQQSQLDVYYQIAVSRGAEFQSVFTADTMETIQDAQSIEKSFYPSSIAPEVRAQYFKDVKTLAEKGWQGWAKGPGELYRHWKYYRPPENCVRAMSWISIMEGARSVALWSLAPPSEKTKDFIHRTEGKPGVEYINSVLGWDGKGTPQFDEFSEFAVKIQRYAKMVNSMVKERKDAKLDAPPLGHQIAPNTKVDHPALEMKSDDVEWRSFKVDGYAGKVVLIVNTAVGSWCAGRSPHYISKNDAFKIDDFGNLTDYIPFRKARKLEFALTDSGSECVDIQSGAVLAQPCELAAAPGGGAFVFIQRKGSGEWLRFKKQFGL